MVKSSKKYELNKEDGVKIGKGALIAIGSVLITYAAQTIPNVNFGQYTPLVVGFSGILINFAKKFLASQ